MCGGMIAPEGEPRARVADLSRKLDRRVVVKAAAALGAMAFAGALPTTHNPAVAQSGTRAGTWTEGGEGIGAASWTGGPNSFQADFPFTAVGVHWDGSVGFPVQVAMSFSGDGATFSEPVMVSATVDGGQPDREGRIYGDLAFASNNTWVQYETMDGNGQPTQVPGLSFTYIDASSGPVSFDASSAASVSAAVAAPAIIARADWGADDSLRYSDRGEIWPPEYATVEHVIIHHTETSNTQDPFVAIRSIYYYHAVTRGWGDIGYNYLVDNRGNVYEGRVGGENAIAGHAFQYNEGSAGIGVMGNFSFQDTTLATQAAIVSITAFAGRDLDPYGSKQFFQVPNLPVICSHRDVNQTSCPGDFLYADLPMIRQYVSEVLVGGTGPDGDAQFAIGEQLRTTVTGGNLRSDATIAASVVAPMVLGTLLTTTGSQVRADGYVWYPVTGQYGDGWAATIILERVGDVPVPNADFALGDAVFVDTDLLNLRSQPGLTGGIVATLVNGTTGTIADGPRDAGGLTWYEIDTAQGTGWVAGQFLAAGTTIPEPVPGGFGVGDDVLVDTDRLNMRAGPGFGQQVVAILPFNTPLTITEVGRQADGLTWYGVQSMDQGSGWCVGDFLAPGGPGGAPIPGDEYQVGETVVTTDFVNMRSGPALNRSIMGTIPPGVSLEVTGGAVSADGYTWYGVFTSGYGGGWVVSDFITRSDGNQPEPTPTPLPPPTVGTLPVGQVVRVINGSLNLRSAAGIGSVVVNVVPDGTRFTVTGASTIADGYTWYPVQNASYGRGFCAGEFLQVV